MKDGKYQKSFIQKRPDPAHPGKWLKGVKDKDGNRLVRNVPYHLPGMIEAAANDHPIVIVEGEAKADLLATWNICATCNAGGAKHWGPEHSAFFKDADVIILPDNDSAGFEHTDVVGRSLTGIAKRIRRLALPNLSPKGDILNWAQLAIPANNWMPRLPKRRIGHRAPRPMQRQSNQSNQKSRTSMFLMPVMISSCRRRGDGF